MHLTYQLQGVQTNIYAFYCTIIHRSIFASIENSDLICYDKTRQETTPNAAK